MSVNISAHVTGSRGGGSRTEITDAISRYLNTKRALGCRFNTEERSLRMFERFLAKQRLRRADQITSECVDRFLASRPRLEPLNRQNAAMPMSLKGCQPSLPESISVEDRRRVAVGSFGVGR